MAKSVIIRGVTYPDVPSVTIPLSTGSGDATFTDTSDATISGGGQMLNGVTAYNAAGVKVTGTIASKSSSDLSVSGATVTAPAGYYASAASKSVASGSATPPASITGNSADVVATVQPSILKLTKTISVTPTVSAGYVSSGTAGNVTVSLAATMPVINAATITPGTTDQTIAAGTYLNGAQTIAGDANLVPGKIVYPYSIFGVTGTAQIPVITQDSTTKVLSIS